MPWAIHLNDFAINICFKRYLNVYLFGGIGV